jgi:hypothetical protein
MLIIIIITCVMHYYMHKWKAILTQVINPSLFYYGVKINTDIRVSLYGLFCVLLPAFGTLLYFILLLSLM